MSLLNHLNVLFLACLILLKLVKYPSCLVFDLPRRRRRIVLALDIFIVFTDLIFSLGHINLAKSARRYLFRFVFPFLYMLPFGACPVAQLFQNVYTLLRPPTDPYPSHFLPLLLNSDTPSPRISVHTRLHQQRHSLYGSVNLSAQIATSPHGYFRRRRQNQPHALHPRPVRRVARAKLH